MCVLGSLEGASFLSLPSMRPGADQADNRNPETPVHYPLHIDRAACTCRRQAKRPERTDTLRRKNNNVKRRVNNASGRARCYAERARAASSGNSPRRAGVMVSYPRRKSPPTGRGCYGGACSIGHARPAAVARTRSLFAACADAPAPTWTGGAIMAESGTPSYPMHEGNSAVSASQTHQHLGSHPNSLRDFGGTQ